MKKEAAIYFLAGLAVLFLTGLIGDHIFDPHHSSFSFQIFSNYAIAALLLITTGWLNGKRS